MDKSLESNQRISRTVKVIGTRKKTITSDAITWGELKTHLEAEDIDVDNMKAILGSTKTTLEINQSVLPNDDFVLHLVPQKTKAGVDVDAMPYAELRASIKDSFNSNSVTAGEHFNQNKNYTNKSTAELKELLKSWLAKNGSSTTFSTQVEKPITEAQKTAANVELGKNTFAAPNTKTVVHQEETISSKVANKLAQVEQLIVDLEDIATDLDVSIEEEESAYDGITEANNELRNVIDTLKEVITNLNQDTTVTTSASTVNQKDPDDEEHEQLMKLLR